MTHVVVGLMVIRSVELVAFVVVIVGMPIAVSSHGRIALTTVILGLKLTTDHSLLAAWVPYMRAPSVRRCCTSYPHETDSWHSSVDDQLPRRACKSSGSRSCDDRDHNDAYHRQRISVTGARRVSDGVALAAHMKPTVGILRSMTNYPAELAEIRAVLGAMIVTTMSADHRQRISVVRSKSFSNRLSLQIVLRGLANPPGSVDVIPTAGCAQCAWCSLLTFVRAWALGALF